MSYVFLNLFNKVKGRVRARSIAHCHKGELLSMVEVPLAEWIRLASSSEAKPYKQVPILIAIAASVVCLVATRLIKKAKYP